MADVVAPVAESSTPAASPSSAPASANTNSAPIGSSPGNSANTAPPTNALAATEGSKPTETPVEKKRRLLKLKVDGAEEEVDLDSIPDEKLALELQMSRAASKRMQEAAELRKKVEGILEFGKSKPWELLKELGLDPDKLVEEDFARRYKESTLTEPEREKLALEQKLKKYQEQEENQKRQFEAQQQAKLHEEVAKATVRDFNEAFKVGGIPQTPENLAIMAQIAQVNNDYGLDLTPAQLAAETKERIHTNTKYSLAGLKGDALVQFLGDEVVKEIIKTSVARVRGAQQQATQVPSQNASTASTNWDEGERPKRQIKSVSEFRKYLRS